MLYEIRCDAFKNKKIKFNSGLNTILGTELGDNSIGKSTFLLIVDFAFGGSTYCKSKDILENIGEHTIYFSFKFNDEQYFFARDFINHNSVYICDEKYKKMNEIKLKDYYKFLGDKYKIDLTYMTFRDVVGRYIRVYGKDNINENMPLNNVSKENNTKAMYDLIKLFGEYSFIEELVKNAEECKNRLESYEKAQKFNFIPKIDTSTYEKNQEEIKYIEEEINNLNMNFEKNLLDLDFEASEEAIIIKNLLFKFRRLRNKLENRLNSIEENLDYKFNYREKDFQRLLTYFSDANIQQIKKIENFHKNISIILKDELKEEKKIINLELKDINISILEQEKNLKEITNGNNISKTILRKYSNMDSRIKALKNANKAYDELNKLKEDKKENEDKLNEVKKEQFNNIEIKINSKMREINELIYGKSSNQPKLNLNNKGYKFYTPNDTGTGIAYKGLIVFDLTILNLTKLPLIVHDSILLKQISDTTIEKILKLYKDSGKQVIISLDKQDSYTKEANRILKENCVLELAPNGNELFGRSWGNSFRQE